VDKPCTLYADRQTDGQTDRQGETYIPPQTLFAGGIINFCVNIFCQL